MVLPGELRTTDDGDLQFENPYRTWNPGRMDIASLLEDHLQLLPEGLDPEPDVLEQLFEVSLPHSEADLSAHLRPCRDPCKDRLLSWLHYVEAYHSHVFAALVDGLLLLSGVLLAASMALNAAAVWALWAHVGTDLAVIGLVIYLLQYPATSALLVTQLGRNHCLTACFAVPMFDVLYLLALPPLQRCTPLQRRRLTRRFTRLPELEIWLWQYRACRQLVVSVLLSVPMAVLGVVACLKTWQWSGSMVRIVLVAATMTSAIQAALGLGEAALNARWAGQMTFLSYAILALKLNGTKKLPYDWQAHLSDRRMLVKSDAAEFTQLSRPQQCQLLRLALQRPYFAISNTVTHPRPPPKSAAMRGSMTGSSSSVVAVAPDVVANEAKRVVGCGALGAAVAASWLSLNAVVMAACAGVPRRWCGGMGDDKARRRNRRDSDCSSSSSDDGFGPGGRQAQAPPSVCLLLQSKAAVKTVVGLLAGPLAAARSTLANCEFSVNLVSFTDAVAYRHCRSLLELVIRQGLRSLVLVDAKLQLDFFGVLTSYLPSRTCVLSRLVLKDVMSGGISTLCMLCEGLSGNSSVSYLDLSNNQLWGLRGAKEVRMMLRGTGALRVLLLPFCNVASLGAVEILHGAAECPSLERIDFSQNHIGDDVPDWSDITELRNTGLREIDLSFNWIQDSLMGWTAALLEAFPSLQRLHLNHNSDAVSSRVASRAATPRMMTPRTLTPRTLNPSNLRIASYSNQPPSHRDMETLAGPMGGALPLQAPLSQAAAQGRERRDVGSVDEALGSSLPQQPQQPFSTVQSAASPSSDMLGRSRGQHLIAHLDMYQLQRPASAAAPSAAATNAGGRRSQRHDSTAGTAFGSCVGGVGYSAAEALLPTQGSMTYGTGACNAAVEAGGRPPGGLWAAVAAMELVDLRGLPLPSWWARNQALRPKSVQIDESLVYNEPAPPPIAVGGGGLELPCNIIRSLELGLSQGMVVIDLNSAEYKAASRCHHLLAIYTALQFATHVTISNSTRGGGPSSGLHQAVPSAPSVTQHSGLALIRSATSSLPRTNSGIAAFGLSTGPLNCGGGRLRSENGFVTITPASGGANAMSLRKAPLSVSTALMANRSPAGCINGGPRMDRASSFRTAAGGAVGLSSPPPASVVSSDLGGARVPYSRRGGGEGSVSNLHRFAVERGSFTALGTGGIFGGGSGAAAATTALTAATAAVNGSLSRSSASVSQGASRGLKSVTENNPFHRAPTYRKQLSLMNISSTAIQLQPGVVQYSPQWPASSDAIRSVQHAVRSTEAGAAVTAVGSTVAAVGADGGGGGGGETGCGPGGGGGSSNTVSMTFPSRAHPPSCRESLELHTPELLLQLQQQSRARTSPEGGHGTIWSVAGGGTTQSAEEEEEAALKLLTSVTAVANSGTIEAAAVAEAVAEADSLDAGSQGHRFTSRRRMMPASMTTTTAASVAAGAAAVERLLLNHDTSPMATSSGGPVNTSTGSSGFRPSSLLLEDGMGADMFDAGIAVLRASDSGRTNVAAEHRAGHAMTAATSHPQQQQQQRAAASVATVVEVGSVGLPSSVPARSFSFTPASRASPEGSSQQSTPAARPQRPPAPAVAMSPYSTAIAVDEHLAAVATTPAEHSALLQLQGGVSTAGEITVPGISQGASGSGGVGINLHDRASLGDKSYTDDELEVSFRIECAAKAALLTPIKASDQGSGHIASGSSNRGLCSSPMGAANRTPPGSQFTVDPQVGCDAAAEVKRAAGWPCSGQSESAAEYGEVIPFSRTPSGETPPEQQLTPPAPLPPRLLSHRRGPEVFSGVGPRARAAAAAACYAPSTGCSGGVGGGVGGGGDGVQFPSVLQELRDEGGGGAGMPRLPETAGPLPDPTSIPYPYPPAGPQSREWGLTAGATGLGSSCLSSPETAPVPTIANIGGGSNPLHSAISVSRFFMRACSALTAFPPTDPEDSALDLEIASSTTGPTGGSVMLEGPAATTRSQPQIMSPTTVATAAGVASGGLSGNAFFPPFGFGGGGGAYLGVEASNAMAVMLMVGCDGQLRVPLRCLELPLRGTMGRRPGTTVSFRVTGLSHDGMRQLRALMAVAKVSMPERTYAWLLPSHSPSMQLGTASGYVTGGGGGPGAGGSQTVPSTGSFYPVHSAFGAGGGYSGLGLALQAAGYSGPGSTGGGTMTSRALSRMDSGMVYGPMPSYYFDGRGQPIDLGFILPPPTDSAEPSGCLFGPANSAVPPAHAPVIPSPVPLAGVSEGAELEPPQDLVRLPPAVSGALAVDAPKLSAVTAVSYSADVTGLDAVQSSCLRDTLVASVPGVASTTAATATNPGAGVTAAAMVAAFASSSSVVGVSGHRNDLQEQPLPSRLRHAAHNAADASLGSPFQAAVSPTSFCPPDLDLEEELQESSASSPPMLPPIVIHRGRTEVAATIPDGSGSISPVQVYGHVNDLQSTQPHHLHRDLTQDGRPVGCQTNAASTSQLCAPDGSMHPNARNFNCESSSSVRDSSRLYGDSAGGGRSESEGEGRATPKLPSGFQHSDILYSDILECVGDGKLREVPDSRSHYVFSGCGGLATSSTLGRQSLSNLIMPELWPIANVASSTPLPPPPPQ